MTEIPHWTVEEQNDDGNPVGWRNQNNGKILAILHNDETGEWVVTGENTRLKIMETYAEALDFATDYMLDTPRPSAMV